MTKEYLINLINMCFDATQESKAGPMSYKNEKDELVINSIAVTTYADLLISLCPKKFSSNITMKEPGEDWKAPGCDH